MHGHLNLAHVTKKCIKRSN